MRMRLPKVFRIKLSFLQYKRVENSTVKEADVNNFFPAILIFTTVLGVVAYVLLTTRC